MNTACKTAGCGKYLEADESLVTGLCEDCRESRNLRRPVEWDKILNTQIIDWDGFENRDPLGFIMSREEFEQRAMRATRMNLVGRVLEKTETAPTTETASTGAIRSQLYPKGAKFPARYDLMMRNGAGMRRLAETYGEGVARYSPDNWMNGFDESVMISHALEHLRLHLAGDKTEDNLAHSCWNLMTLMWIEENKPELMDITKPAQKL